MKWYLYIITKHTFHCILHSIYPTLQWIQFIELCPIMTPEFRYSPKIVSESGECATLTNEIKPVCIPRTKKQFKAPKNCTITGWGKLSATCKYLASADALVLTASSPFTFSRAPIQLHTARSYGATDSVEKVWQAKRIRWNQNVDVLRGLHERRNRQLPGRLWRTAGLSRRRRW